MMMTSIRFLTKESCSILYRTLSSSASSLSNTKSALKTIIAATDTDNDDNHQPLMDTHGRRHDYLRISLTERCNLRCKIDFCVLFETLIISFIIIRSLLYA